jgi:hypothetical protein
MADAKRIAKQFFRSIGKGLWWFFKAVGREIQRSYRRYQETQRARAIRQGELDMIREDNMAAAEGDEMGRANIREQERIRRQNEREQRDYSRRMNEMYKVQPVNNAAFFGDPPRKKKKRNYY